MNKEVLIKQLAASMELPEDVIFKVISFQGEDALKAVKVHDEVEFSGFGKFYLSQTKLKKFVNNIKNKLTKLDPSTHQTKIEQLSNYLESINVRIK